MINNLTGSTYPINPADTWDRLWEQVTIEEEFWVKVKQSTIQSRIDLVVYDIKDADMYFPEAEIQGVLKGGNISVNSGSAVRRTASFELIPSLYKREQEIEEWEEENGYAYYVHLGGDLAKWLTKKIRVILWIRDFWYGTDPNDNDGGTWYPFNMGMFMLSSANSSYDAQNNTLSIELTDMMAMLDGTLNGQVGGVISTVIPAYEEDPETGEPISHNSIAKAIEHVCDMAGLSGWQYIIDEVGEHMAFPMFNLSGWEKYREEHPLWNMIPYDLEFSTGATMWSIIEELVNLYPNFDCAFDKNGVLRVRLIPSSDSVYNCFGFSDYYDLIISEQVSTDLSTVRNICEVWGEGMDTDWYTDDVTQGKYVVYDITINKPDDNGTFYIDLKYIIQEKTIKTERLTCYRNLATDVDWEEIKILYDNSVLKIKALKDGMVYENNTYNTNQIIYSCEYNNIGISPGLPDPNYTYDSALGWSCLNSYYVYSTTQLISTHGRAFYKLYEGGTIVVEWHIRYSDYNHLYGPVLISTVENNVLYTDNPTPMANSPYLVNGVYWYISTLEYWNNLSDDPSVPVFDADYLPSDNPSKAIADILTASGYIVGQKTLELSPYQFAITRTSDANVYEVPLEGYPTKYRTGDKIAVDFRNTNIANQMMRINNLDPLPIINQMDKMPVGANFFDTEHTHVFQITKEKATKEVNVFPYPEEHDLVGRWDGQPMDYYRYKAMGLETVSATSASGFDPMGIFRTTDVYNLSNHSDYWCGSGIDSYIDIELAYQAHITKIQYYAIIPEGYHSLEFTVEYKPSYFPGYTWMHATSFSYDNTSQGEFVTVELDKPIDGRLIRITCKGEGFNIGALHFIGWTWNEPTMSLIPRMTSSTCEAGVATSHDRGTETAFWAFNLDDNSNPAWFKESSNDYLQFEFNEPVYITSWDNWWPTESYITMSYSEDGENFTETTKCTYNGDGNNRGYYFADEVFKCKYVRISKVPNCLASVHFYGFKAKDVTTSEEDTFVNKFYYLGVAQAHAIDVITDGTIIENGWWDPGDNEHKGRYYDKYSQEYYERILNCDVVSLTVRKDSPFVVQKLGDRIDVKEGGEFANITSNELALERAQYENWKNSRMSDNVTITTKLLPFIEPFMKIDYKKANSKEKRDYIVNSVSHDFDNGTTTIQMATFYPLYKENPGNNSAMTYNYMAGYRNEDLSGDEDEIL